MKPSKFITECALCTGAIGLFTFVVTLFVCLMSLLTLGMWHRIHELWITL